MNKEEIISKLMDYLYDEMPSSERESFEVWLRDNPTWKSELDELTQSKNSLKILEVKEAPKIRVLAPPTDIKQKWYKSWMGVAASLALLISLGALSKAQVSYKSGTFTLSFGNSPKVENSEPNSKTVFTQATNAEPSNLNYQEILQTKLVDAESRLLQLMHQNNQQLTQQLNQKIKINSKPSLPTNFITYEDLLSFREQEHKLRKEEQNQIVDQLIQYIDLNNQQNKELIRNGFIELSRQLPASFDNRMTKLK